MVILLFKLPELVPNECVISDLRKNLRSQKNTIRYCKPGTVIKVFLNAYSDLYVFLYPCRGYNDFRQMFTTQ